MDGDCDRMWVAEFVEDGVAAGMVVDDESGFPEGG